MVAVILIEGQTLARTAFTACIESMDGYELVVDVESVQALLAIASTLVRPDIILYDANDLDDAQVLWEIDLLRGVWSDLPMAIIRAATCPLTLVMQQHLQERGVLLFVYNNNVEFSRLMAMCDRACHHNAIFPQVIDKPGH